MSNDGVSREAAVAGFGAFGAATVNDGVTVRRRMWMIGEAACEGVVSESIWSSTARIAHTFSCDVLRIEGTFRRMLMPPEVETERSAVIAAEKTKEVLLMQWWSTTIREPAQNPPEEFRSWANEPTSISTRICVAYETRRLD